MADEIREAQVRNYAKWTGVGPRFGGFQGEIDHLKQWLQTRCTWVDGQFVAPPQDRPGGRPHRSRRHGEPGQSPRQRRALLHTRRLGPASARVRLSHSWRPPCWRPRARPNACSCRPGRSTMPGAATRTSTIRPGSAARAASASSVRAATSSSSRSISATRCTDATQAAAFASRSPSRAIPQTINIMTLKVRYDDGFVAYLNGVGDRTCAVPWRADVEFRRVRQS